MMCTLPLGPGDAQERGIIEKNDKGGGRERLPPSPACSPGRSKKQCCLSLSLSITASPLSLSHTNIDVPVHTTWKLFFFYICAKPSSAAEGTLERGLLHSKSSLLCAMFLLELGLVCPKGILPQVNNPSLPLAK